MDFGVSATSTRKELPESLKADSDTSRDSVGSDDQSCKSNTHYPPSTLPSTASSTASSPQSESPPSHTRASLDQARHVQHEQGDDAANGRSYAGCINIYGLDKQLSTSTITSSEHSTITTQGATLEALQIEIKKAMEAKVEAIAAMEATDALLEAERIKSALLSSEKEEATAQLEEERKAKDVAFTSLRAKENNSRRSIVTSVFNLRTMFRPTSQVLPLYSSPTYPADPNIIDKGTDIAKHDSDNSDNTSDITEPPPATPHFQKPYSQYGSGGQDHPTTLHHSTPTFATRENSAPLTSMS